MTRLSLRARLTLIFSTAMALVLTVTGFVLYNHLASSLDRTLNQSMRARTSDILALVRQADTGLRESRPSSSDRPGNGFAQVLDSRGRIFDETPGLGRAPLLTPSQLRHARDGTLLVSRTRNAGDVVRLLASPVSAQGKRLVIVVNRPRPKRQGRR